MLELFLIFMISALSWAQALSTLPNGFTEGAKAPKEIPVSEINLSEANNLFKDFANNKDIPFGDDGHCFARATAMGRMAEKKGITIARIYVEGQLAVAPRDPYQALLWQYHVAPVVKVTRPGSPSVLMVLDPSLFKKPVSVDEWKSALLFKGYEGCRDDNPNECTSFVPKIRKTYFGNQYQYWPLIDKKAENRRYRSSYELPDLQNMREAFAESHRISERLAKMNDAEANDNTGSDQNDGKMQASSESAKTNDFFNEEMFTSDLPVGEFFDSIFEGIR